MKKKKKNGSAALLNALKQLHPDYVPPYDLTDDAPESGAKRYWFLLKNHLYKFAILSCVFCMTSLPIITIPATSSALCHTMMQLWRKGNCTTFLRSYFKAFADQFMDKSLAGLAVAAVPSTLALALVTYTDIKEGLALGLAFALYLMLGAVWEYLVVMVDSVDLTFGENLRNAAILMLTNLKWTALLMLIDALTILVLYFLFPWWVPVLMFLGFAMRQLLLCAIVWPIVQRRVLGQEPEEEDEE